MSKEKTPEELYLIAANAGQKIGAAIDQIYKAVSIVTNEDIAAMDEYNRHQEAIMPITNPTIARAAYGVNAFQRIRERVELIKRIKQHKEAGI